MDKMHVDGASTGILRSCNFQVNRKLIVNGGGVVTALNDDYGNPHSLSMGWGRSDLMVLVDSTWFHLSTSDHNLWDPR